MSITTLQRVNTLLEGHLHQILRQEQHNADRVNLYDVGEYWVAFERSAYQLEQMSRKADDTVMLHLAASPFPIAMHCMHHTRVNAMCRKHVMARKSMEYLQLLTRPIDDKSYAQWYQDHIDS